MLTFIEGAVALGRRTTLSAPFVAPAKVLDTSESSDGKVTRLS